MARQPVVLEMLFRAAPAQQGSTNLLIFSLLVPFIHRDGAIGQQARDALLLVMAASASNEAVAHYIAENSYFCPVSVDTRVFSRCHVKCCVLDDRRGGVERMWLQVALNLGAFSRTQIFLKKDFFLCSLALILRSNMFSEQQMAFEGFLKVIFKCQDMITYTLDGHSLG